jgi:nitrate reductase gamma subunit
MTTQSLVFLFVLTLGAGFFALNVQRLVSYLRIGVAEGRTDHPLTRIRNLFEVGIAQKKILRDPVAGPMHALIFWGFMVLTAGTVEILIAGVVPSFSYARFLPGLLYTGYSASQDVFAALVILAVGFALYRRIVLHPKRLEGDNLEHTDALIILSLIMGLMVTLILSTGFLLAAQPEAFGSEKIVSRPVGVIVGLALSPSAAMTGFHVFWWAHVLLILSFLNYLPYSKHLHVATSLINVFFSNTNGPGPRGVMPYMDLEADVEQFGASDVEQLSWKNLLDGYSCTEHYRQAPESAQDHGQHAPAAHGESARDDERPNGLPASRAAARRGRRRGRDDGRGGDGAPAVGHVYHRGGALGVHELPCLRHRMPGVDRSTGHHQPDATQPGADRVSLSR